MSGGSLNYFCYKLQEHAGDFHDKELDELVADMAELFRDREDFLSGDTCEGHWNEARDKFKTKWFTESGQQERIEKYLAELEEEVRRTFGLSRRYRKTCKRWKAEPGSEYGKCEITKGCLMHRSETCEKWEEKEDGE